MGISLQSGSSNGCRWMSSVIEVLTAEIHVLSLRVSESIEAESSIEGYDPGRLTAMLV